MGESESIFLERHSRVEEGGRREINIQKTGLSGSGTLKRRWNGEPPTSRRTANPPTVSAATDPVQMVVVNGCFSSVVVVFSLPQLHGGGVLHKWALYKEDKMARGGTSARYKRSMDSSCSRHLALKAATSQLGAILRW